MTSVLPSLTRSARITFKSVQRQARARLIDEMYGRSTSRGALLLFEGIDKSGKSTQVDQLVTTLRQKQVKVERVRFPDRETRVGSLLGSYLSGDAHVEPDVVHLLFASNRFEKRDEILKLLDSGTTIVMDRYAYSGAAFTMAKKVEGLDMKWCKALEAGKLPAPDVVFYMSLPVSVTSTRSGFGAEKYEKSTMQESVVQAFEELMIGEQWQTIDASRTPDEIAHEILPHAMEVIKVCQEGKRPLHKLWID